MTNTNSPLNCEDDFCAAAPQETSNQADPPISKGKLLYFGDPMCSWCWGITPTLAALKAQYAGTLEFELVMGGLRPGGGDPWTPAFKNMLRGHWNHVQEASGQPFNFGLFDKADFNYDTEPPARAVRIVRDLAPHKEFAFYEAVQRRFYVENEDPAELAFYQPICIELEISFDAFSLHFPTDTYKKLVREDFYKSQSLGIRGFPTVVLQTEEGMSLVAQGFATKEAMEGRIENVLSLAS